MKAAAVPDVTPQELDARTHEFARVVVLFCTPLLDDHKNWELIRQLLKSGTAVSANYGSAREARSRDEFVAKLGQVVDDASESWRWLRLFRDSKRFVETEHFTWLLQEAEELTKIFARSHRTARLNNEKRKADEKSKRQKKRRRPTK